MFDYGSRLIERVGQRQQPPRRRPAPPAVGMLSQVVHSTDLG